LKSIKLVARAAFRSAQGSYGSRLANIIGMPPPRAIATGAVDLILPVEAMPERNPPIWHGATGGVISFPQDLSASIEQAKCVRQHADGEWRRSPTQDDAAVQKDLDESLRQLQRIGGTRSPRPIALVSRDNWTDAAAA
jgi:hypothetical protein